MKCNRLALFMLVPSSIWASAGGAPTGYTGSPADNGYACEACHGARNASTGNVKVIFPGSSYTPGATYRVQVVITDTAGKRWGFELGSWKAGVDATPQVGSLKSSDTNTHVLVAGTNRYITQTSAGTRIGALSPVTFEFDWTAPAAGTGDVVFYAAAVAANNNGREDSGDHVYSTQLLIPEASAATDLPTLRTTDPALPAFGATTAGGFASNGYLELYGDKLANTVRQWTGADFTGPKAPTTLDGVSVKVNGKDAAIYYVSSGQVNINAPDDPATGPVSIEVTNNGKTGASVTMMKSAVAPALLTTNAFTIGGKRYVVALLPASTVNGPFVGSSGLIAGVAFKTVKPGDRIILYALGCGPTDPATTAGTTTAVKSNVSSPYKLVIGGQEATVEFFGAIPGSIGLYQINAVIPNVSAGDQAIELTVAGVTTGQNLFLSGVTN